MSYLEDKEKYHMFRSNLQTLMRGKTTEQQKAIYDHYSGFASDSGWDISDLAPTELPPQELPSRILNEFEPEPPSWGEWLSDQVGATLDKYYPQPDDNVFMSAAKRAASPLTVPMGLVHEMLTPDEQRSKYPFVDEFQNLGKVLDYGEGLTTRNLGSGVSHTIDALIDPNVTAGDALRNYGSDFRKALVGEAPGWGQHLETAHVPPGPSYVFPYVGEVSLRDAAGAVGDVFLSTASPLASTARLTQGALAGAARAAAKTADEAVHTGKKLLKKNKKKAVFNQDTGAYAGDVGVREPGFFTTGFEKTQDWYKSSPTAQRSLEPWIRSDVAAPDIPASASSKAVDAARAAVKKSQASSIGAGDVPQTSMELAVKEAGAEPDYAKFSNLEKQPPPSPYDKYYGVRIPGELEQISKENQVIDHLTDPKEWLIEDYKSLDRLFNRIPPRARTATGEIDPAADAARKESLLKEGLTEDEISAIDNIRETAPGVNTHEEYLSTYSLHAPDDARYRSIAKARTSADKPINVEDEYYNPSKPPDAATVVELNNKKLLAPRVLNNDELIAYRADLKSSPEDMANYVDSTIPEKFREKSLEGYANNIRDIHPQPGTVPQPIPSSTVKKYDDSVEAFLKTGKVDERIPFGVDTAARLRKSISSDIKESPDAIQDRLRFIEKMDEMGFDNVFGEGSYWKYLYSLAGSTFSNPKAFQQFQSSGLSKTKIGEDFLVARGMLPKSKHYATNAAFRGPKAPRRAKEAYRDMVQDAFSRRPPSYLPKNFSDDLYDLMDRNKITVDAKDPRSIFAAFDSFKGKAHPKDIDRLDSLIKKYIDAKRDADSIIEPTARYYGATEVDAPTRKIIKDTFELLAKARKNYSDKVSPAKEPILEPLKRLASSAKSISKGENPFRGQTAPNVPKLLMDTYLIPHIRLLEKGADKLTYTFRDRAFKDLENSLSVKAGPKGTVKRPGDRSLTDILHSNGAPADPIKLNSWLREYKKELATRQLAIGESATALGAHVDLRRALSPHINKIEELIKSPATTKTQVLELQEFNKYLKDIRDSAPSYPKIGKSGSPTKTSTGFATPNDILKYRAAFKSIAETLNVFSGNKDLASVYDAFMGAMKALDKGFIDSLHSLEKTDAGKGIGRLLIKEFDAVANELHPLLQIQDYVTAGAKSAVHYKFARPIDSYLLIGSMGGPVSAGALAAKKATEALGTFRAKKMMIGAPKATLRTLYGTEKEKKIQRTKDKPNPFRR